ncbi:MAG: hypothetical protein ACMXX6_01755 [Candidatus Woesearchaeota archaeon]
MSDIKKLNTIKKIKKDGSVCKVEYNNKTYLLKKYNKSFFSFFRLKKEVKVSKALDKKPEINVPSVIKHDENNVLFEYIDNKELEQNDRKIAAKKLAEFHNCNIKLNRNIKNRFLDILINKPYFALQRILILNIFKLGLKNYFKIQVLLNKLKKKQKEFNKLFLLHNDFYKNNVLMTENKEVYFCDLESVVKDSKWFMIDVVKYSATKPYFYDLDKDFIKSYLKELKNSYKDVYKKLNTKAQIRLALILYLTRKLKNTKKYKNTKNFLTETLLDDKKYNKWFNKEIKPIIP